MTTAKKRTESATCEKTLTQEIAELETAIETMAAYVGYLNTLVMQEKREEFPNTAKIDAMKEQMRIVLNERNQMHPDNHKLISRALYVYAPIMKAIYEADSLNGR